VLFINGADQKYTSKYLDGDLAAAYATNQTQEKVKQAKSTASLLPAQPLKVGI
jgi:hypothetical protein